MASEILESYTPSDSLVEIIWFTIERHENLQLHPHFTGWIVLLKFKDIKKYSSQFTYIHCTSIHEIRLRKEKTEINKKTCNDWSYGYTVGTFSLLMIRKEVQEPTFVFIYYKMQT